ncbi:MAG: hypothetical protein ACAI43_19395 [Phycisphaerae bacterium]
MPRQNTRNESEGAEFLVLGHLLIAGVPAFKAYSYTPAYDVVATDPARHTSARISVKSRWATGAPGFICKRFDCDFVVIVKLNRGSKDGRRKVGEPEFFVVPAKTLEAVPRSAKWNKIHFRDIPNFESYRNRWESVREFLKSPDADRALTSEIPT